MSKLWLLLPGALVCTLLFPPLGLRVSGGRGDLVLRNVFAACSIAVVVLGAVLQGRSNL